MKTDLSAVLPLYVEDEFLLLRNCVDLLAKSVLDVGCGAGVITKRIGMEGRARRVVGIDVDESQLRKLAETELAENVAFEKGGAESLGFAEGVFDCVTMFKSLHHVPVGFMETALTQVHRVLKTAGVLFVSEPVYAGHFNDLMKIFHDEGEVRKAAINAVDWAVASGLFALDRHVDFLSPVSFNNFEDFRTKMMNVTHNKFVFTPDLISKIRLAYEAHQTNHGAFFTKPMRVDVLIKI